MKKHFRRPAAWILLAALMAAGIGLPVWRAHRKSKRALAAAAEAEKKEK